MLVSECLAPSPQREYSAQEPGQAGTDAPEQPVLNVRNQPDSHCPGRTERRWHVRVLDEDQLRFVTY
jgi:hypothetical protein